MMTKLACLLALLYAIPARADVVRPPPKDCPEGHTPRTSHRGPYCQPPAPKCKDGETPRPTGGSWYCEQAPPKGGCLPGSEWWSRSATDAFCRGRPCTPTDRTPTCKATSLCAKTVPAPCPPRMGPNCSNTEERVTGPCEAGGKCTAEGATCVTTNRIVNIKANDTPGPSPQPKQGLRLYLPPLFVGAIVLAVWIGRRRRR